MDAKIWSAETATTEKGQGVDNDPKYAHAQEKYACTFAHDSLQVDSPKAMRINRDQNSGSDNHHCTNSNGEWKRCDKEKQNT